MISTVQWSGATSICDGIILIIIADVVIFLLFWRANIIIADIDIWELDPNNNNNNMGEQQK